MESPSSPASFPLFPRKVWDRPPPSESGFGGQVALRWGRALDTCRAAPVSQFRTLSGPGTRVSSRSMSRTPLCFQPRSPASQDPSLPGLRPGHPAFAST